MALCGFSEETNCETTNIATTRLIPRGVEIGNERLSLKKTQCKAGGWACSSMCWGPAPCTLPDLSPEECTAKEVLNRVATGAGPTCLSLEAIGNESSHQRYDFVIFLTVQVESGSEVTAVIVCRYREFLTAPSHLPNGNCRVLYSLTSGLSCPLTVAIAVASCQNCWQLAKRNVTLALTACGKRWSLLTSTTATRLSPSWQTSF